MGCNEWVRPLAVNFHLVFTVNKIFLLHSNNPFDDRIGLTTEWKHYIASAVD